MFGFLCTEGKNLGLNNPKAKASRVPMEALPPEQPPLLYILQATSAGHFPNFLIKAEAPICLPCCLRKSFPVGTEGEHVPVPPSGGPPPPSSRNMAPPPRPPPPATWRRLRSFLLLLLFIFYHYSAPLLSSRRLRFGSGAAGRP